MCPVENEYKFTSDDVPDVNSCIASIKTFLKKKNLDYSVSEKHITDYYYDSENMEITDTGCFLRKRINKSGKCKLTIKKPISNKESMSREEIERESDGSFRDLIDFSATHFPDVEVIDNPMLVLLSDRTVFSMKDGTDAKLTFDVCKYIDGSRFKSFWEIEFEIISDGAQSNFDTYGIKDFIINDLGFKTVTESKYSRGLKWKRS